MFFRDLNFSKVSRYASALLIGTALLTSCGDDDGGETPTPTPTTPTATGSYSFERDGVSTVDLSGPQVRMEMLGELVNEVRKTHVANSNTQVSAVVLKNMYSNSSAPFNNSNLNNRGENLKLKTNLGRPTYYESLFDSVDAASLSALPAAEGRAGVMQRGTGQILLDANGNELLQLIEKGLFIETFYYQATNIYLSTEWMFNRMNTAFHNGENYSEMEYHWDQSFGYSGFNMEYANTTGLEYNAKYIMARNDLDEIGRRIHNAYELGRQNISDQFGKPADEANYQVRNTQINRIRDAWETALAATAVSYLNKAQVLIAGTSDAEVAEKLHLLSEAKAFMLVLRYSDRFSTTEANMIMANLGDNNWDVSNQDIIEAKTAIANRYNLSFNKDYK